MEKELVVFAVNVKDQVITVIYNEIVNGNGEQKMKTLPIELASDLIAVVESEI